MTTSRLAAMIRSGRANLGYTQAEFGKQIGHSRQWVAQLEGASFSGRPFNITPEEILKAAAILKIPPYDLLTAAELPRVKWPNLSHMRSTDGRINTVDITPLTAEQQDIILELVRVLRTGNNNESGKTD